MWIPFQNKDGGGWGVGRQTECILQESLGWPEVGLEMAMVVNVGPSPQGQRKEQSGLEGKGGRPRMEENELYSSATAGEGPLLLPRLLSPGRGGEEVRAGRQPAQSSCLVVAPGPSQPLISCSSSLPARPKVEEASLT